MIFYLTAKAQAFSFECVFCEPGVTNRSVHPPPLSSAMPLQINLKKLSGCRLLFQKQADESLATACVLTHLSTPTSSWCGCSLYSSYDYHGNCIAKKKIKMLVWVMTNSCADDTHGHRGPSTPRIWPYLTVNASLNKILTEVDGGMYKYKDKNSDESCSWDYFSEWSNGWYKHWQPIYIYLDLMDATFNTLK